MTKADKILIVILMICSILLFVPILQNSPKSCMASVTVSGEEVLKIDLRKNHTYEVEGKQGKVYIEVKNQKVRVTQETSKQHICSKQGFVGDPNVPIVCLPNDTVIQILKEENSEDLIIQ